MAKRSLWLSDEDIQRVERITAALEKEPSFRHGDLSAAGVLRFLIRRSLEQLEVDLLHEVPDPPGAMDYLEWETEASEKRLALLRKLADREMAEVDARMQSMKKKPPTEK
jgi:hypothetical protein